MKKFGIWAVAAALFFAPMGLSSCSMGSSASEMKGNLNFTQDDLRRNLSSLFFFVGNAYSPFRNLLHVLLIYFTFCHSEKKLSFYTVN